MAKKLSAAQPASKESQQPHPKPLKQPKSIVKETLKSLPQTQPLDKSSKKYPSTKSTLSPATEGPLGSKPTPKSVKTDQLPSKTQQIKQSPIIALSTPDMSDDEPIKLIPSTKASNTTKASASQHQSTATIEKSAKQAHKSVPQPAHIHSDGETDEPIKLLSNITNSDPMSDDDSFILKFDNTIDDTSGDDEESTSLLSGSDPIKLLKKQPVKVIAHGVGVGKIKSQKRDLLRKIAFRKRANIPTTDLEAKLVEIESQIAASDATNNTIRQRLTPARQKILDYEMNKVKKMLKVDRTALSLIIPGSIVTEEEAQHRTGLALAEEYKLYMKHYPHQMKEYVQIFDDNEANRIKRDAIKNQIFTKLNYTRPTFRMTAGDKGVEKKSRDTQQNSVETDHAKSTHSQANSKSTAKPNQKSKHNSNQTAKQAPKGKQGGKVENNTSAKKGPAVDLDTDVWGGWDDSSD